MMQRMAEVIDAHEWDELATLLAPDFSCRYVHTGEEFGRDDWVRLNADYPGFQHFVLEDCVGAGPRAAGRGHVTGLKDGQREHFGVASFITVHQDRIVDLVEVWTDMHETAAAERRPGAQHD